MKEISCWTICTTKSSRGTKRNMCSSSARIPQVLRAGCPCARAKDIQVDANSTPTRFTVASLSVNRPPPFWGRITKVATHFPPPERGRRRAQICASGWGSNPQLAILSECSPLYASSLADRTMAEFRTHIVDRALDRGAAGQGLVQKIGRIAFCGRADLAEANAEQTIGCSERFAGKKDAPDAKDHIGQLRRTLEGCAPRLDAKRRVFQFQRDGAPADAGCLGARRHTFGLVPQDAFQFRQT